MKRYQLRNNNNNNDNNRGQILFLLHQFLRPMLARSAQHQVGYCHTNSVCPSVRPSVTLLRSAKTVRDSALVTMGS